jgi:hypothetical protein
MHLAARGRKRDGDAEELGHVQRLPSSRSSGWPRIVQYQCNSIAMTGKRERSRRPTRVELSPQRVFMLDSLDGLNRRMFSLRHDQQDRIETIRTAPIQGEFALLQNIRLWPSSAAMKCRYRSAPGFFL